MAKLSLTIPLRWSDLDAYGHVNNVRMLTLLEEARIKAFWATDQSDTGADPKLLERAKVLNADPHATTLTFVAGQRVEYLKPLEWTGQDVRVDLWLGEIGGASLLVCYEVFDHNGDRVAKATTSMVTVDAKTQKPTRISDSDREALSALIDEPVTFRR